MAQASLLTLLTVILPLFINAAVEEGSDLNGWHVVSEIDDEFEKFSEEDFVDFDFEHPASWMDSSFYVLMENTEDALLFPGEEAAEGSENVKNKENDHEQQATQLVVSPTLEQAFKAGESSTVLYEALSPLDSAREAQTVVDRKDSEELNEAEALANSRKGHVPSEEDLENLASYLKQDMRRSKAKVPTTDASRPLRLRRHSMSDARREMTRTTIDASNSLIRQLLNQLNPPVTLPNRLNRGLV